MKSPIISYNSIDFEENPYDPLIFLKHKGEYFSGTVLYDDRKSFTEYENGNVEGRHVEYFNNGQLACDFIYENGKCINEKIWYSNGQFKFDGTHLFDKNGKLICINGTWLYPNGAKRNGKGEGEYYEYSSKGELAIKTIVVMSGDYKNNIIYYDDVLSDCYQELLINNYPDEDQLFYILEYKIWGWVMRKYFNDKTAGMKILKCLSNHTNNKIAKTAIDLLGKLELREISPIDYINNLGYNVYSKMMHQ